MLTGFISQLTLLWHHQQPMMLLMVLSSSILLFLRVHSAEEEDYDQTRDLETKWQWDMIYKVRMDHVKSFMRIRPDEKKSVNNYLGTDVSIRIVYHADDPYGKTLCSVPVYIENESGGNGLVGLRLANGIYNEPSKTPQCLYEFYEAATVSNEYDLFKYCAKGGFFQRKNYNDPARRQHRKNWLLYLTHGRVVCNISGNLEVDRALLAKGYTVKLFQRVFRRGNLCIKLGCEQLQGIASSYTDNRKDGQFMLGATIGSLQLENSDGTFWSKKHMDQLTDLQKKCYNNYDLCVQNDLTHRYDLELQVEHFCTEMGLREQLAFDVSIGSNMVPTGVFEDTGVHIYLNQRQMLRTTGQTKGILG